MLLASINRHDGAALSDRIYDAPAATPTLLREIIDATCRRPVTARIKRLLDAGALTEAALALIDLELPQWQLRRIAYDGGDWYCALSRERELPDWLDQSVEAWHHDLALAILAAFVKAHSASSPRSRASVPSSPREANVRGMAMCCDNFA